MGILLRHHLLEKGSVIYDSATNLYAVDGNTISDLLDNIDCTQNLFLDDDFKQWLSDKGITI